MFFLLSCTKSQHNGKRDYLNFSGDSNPVKFSTDTPPERQIQIYFLMLFNVTVNFATRLACKFKFNS